MNARSFVFRFFAAISMMIGTLCACNAQTNTTRDTFDIYKNKSGIDFDVYMRHWFRRSHSYSLSKLNKQDSIVLNSGAHKYFRVYDKRDRLWFEGATDKFSGMIGDVKWFDEHGHVKRIVHYNMSVPFLNCADSFCSMFEGPAACAWKTYRKNGALKKERTYVVGGDHCDGPNLKCYSKTVRYTRKGEVRSRHTRRITFRRMFSGA